MKKLNMQQFLFCYSRKNEINGEKNSDNNK